jgi:hypothetical protein
MAGIINIVLKANTDLGTAAGSTPLCHSNPFNTGTNLGYQSGPVTYSALTDTTLTISAIVGINDRLRYDPLGRRCRTRIRTSMAGRSTPVTTSPAISTTS